MYQCDANKCIKTVRAPREEVECLSLWYVKGFTSNSLVDHINKITCYMFYVLIFSCFLIIV